MSTEPIADSYALLEIQPGASLQEIQQSYEDLLTIWSPMRFDAGSRLRTKTEKKIQEIDTAYDALRGYYASEIQRIVAQSVIPAQATLEPGQSTQFRLVGIDLDGKVVEIDYVRWSSDGGTITNNGVFSGQTKGHFMVMAHLGAFQAVASVEVLESSSRSSEVSQTQSPSLTDTSKFYTSACVVALALFIGLIVFTFLAGVVQGFSSGPM